MKMTLHIDEDILDKVMEATGASNKTHAVDLALREMARRAELKKLAAEGLGLGAAELREVFDPASDVPSFKPEAPQGPITYGRKPRTGR